MGGGRNESKEGENWLRLQANNQRFNKPFESPLQQRFDHDHHDPCHIPNLK